MTTWALRILATGWLVQVIAQVCLAAGFISGETELFEQHSRNGSLIVLGPMVIGLVSVVHLIVTRSFWPLPVSVLMFVLCGIQIGMGHTRVIGVHIVLGATLLALSFAFALLLWVLTPRRRRS